MNFAAFDVLGEARRRQGREAKGERGRGTMRHTRLSGCGIFNIGWPRARGSPHICRVHLCESPRGSLQDVAYRRYHRPSTRYPRTATVSSISGGTGEPASNLSKTTSGCTIQCGTKWDGLQRRHPSAACNWSDREAVPAHHLAMQTWQTCRGQREVAGCWLVSLSSSPMVTLCCSLSPWLVVEILYSLTRLHK